MAPLTCFSRIQKRAIEIFLNLLLLPNMQQNLEERNTTHFLRNLFLLPNLQQNLGRASSNFLYFLEFFIAPKSVAEFSKGQYYFFLEFIFAPKYVAEFRREKQDAFSQEFIFVPKSVAEFRKGQQYLFTYLFLFFLIFLLLPNLQQNLVRVTCIFS